MKHIIFILICSFVGVLSNAQTTLSTLISTVVYGNQKIEASISDFPQVIQEATPMLGLYLHKDLFPDLPDNIASSVVASLVTVVGQENISYSYDTLDSQTVVRHGSYGQSQATGVIIGHRYNNEKKKWITIIVTCKHCIGQLETDIVYNGYTKKAVVPNQTFSPYCDFGVLLVEDSIGKALPLARLGSSELVYCYNFNKNTEKGISTPAHLYRNEKGGSSASLPYNGVNALRVVALKIRHGYSGGPVVNAQGQLVGLCQSHNGMNKGGYELGYIIETENFLVLLNSTMLMLKEEPIIPVF